MCGVFSKLVFAARGMPRLCRRMCGEALPRRMVE
jgi:hypothetical protein